MSLHAILPAVAWRSSWVCVRRVGRSPTMRTLAVSLTWARLIARIQHAVGSIMAPSSKESSGGNGITAPLATLYLGTREYSAKPHGSMLVFLNSLQRVKSPREQSTH